ncbi:hypothetical protein [Candidatus Methanocrinis natronophilus]|uniref:Uncharacterized protein n=1 Tax=Candidatus Methanocrinis natronophilus TaxID=3033396 RepID=A0ABT5X773_9EURY|nr:hypothetical protein [Candidatus Methanocrinis natronophilus]MDF0590555.1 hypothetical protein [Candidatus Methanocrinis natronophilus]
MRLTGSITGDLHFGISISFYCLIVLLIRISISEASIVGLAAGRIGLVAFVIPSLLKVGVPTMASNAILSPILYAGAVWIRSRRQP